MDKLKIFTGNANPSLAEEISKFLKISLGDAKITKFSDGESNIQISENVRGTDVFIIQPTCPPVNDNLMELLIMVDACRRASAQRITAVVPYYGYARQDRKTEPRVPITAKLVANVLTTAGIDRILVMDLHAGQIQGFFDIPVDHLYAAPVLIEYIKKKKLKNRVVVSPDAGGVERARAFAKRINATVAFIDKRRPRQNDTLVMNVVGEIEGKTAIMLDDIIDTGKTLVRGAEALARGGAIEVYAACSHAVLSGRAIEYINNSVLKEVIITNTIPFTKRRECPKIKILSVAKLLGEAISRIHREVSVSSLFV